MANLTIRNLPDDLHQQLKEQAKRNRRSLNQEAIAVLAAFREKTTGEDSALARAIERTRKAEERLDELRREMPRFLTVEEIDEAKRYGRR